MCFLEMTRDRDGPDNMSCNIGQFRECAVNGKYTHNRKRITKSEKNIGD